MNLTAKAPIRYRDASLMADGTDEENRTIPVSFSSEEPVYTWIYGDFGRGMEFCYGYEILGHEAGDVDMSRAERGLPVLAEHFGQIGIDDSVELDTQAKVLRGMARFGKSARAEEIFQDAKAGIRRFTSVGYRILEYEEIDPPHETPEHPNARWFRAKWRPHEYSFVSVPADITVGTDRSAKEQLGERELFEVKVRTLGDRADPPAPSSPSRRERKEEPDMDPKEEKGRTPDPAPVDVAVVTAEARKDARAEETARVREIMALGEKFKRADIQEHIEKGTTAEEYRSLVLNALSGPEMVRAVKEEENIQVDLPVINMSRKDAARYSLRKAFLAVMEGKVPDGIEGEASKAMRAKGFCTENAKKRDLGATIPLFDLLRHGQLSRAHAELSKRADVDTSTGAGLVATNLVPSLYQDILQPTAALMAMGVTVIEGLVGNMTFPKQTAAAAEEWISETGTPTESSVTYGTGSLSPKTVGIRQDYTRRMLQQSTPAIENLLRMHFLVRLGNAIDKAGLILTGASNDPKGIINETGVGDVSHGTDGGAPTYASMVELQTDVAVANAMRMSGMGYITTAKVRGKLKTVGRKEAGDTSSSGFVWEGGLMGEIDGFRAIATNNLRDNNSKGASSGILSDCVFGYWPDYLIGLWGGPDIVADPYTNIPSGHILWLLQDVDVDPFHVESFSKSTDINAA